MKLPTVSCHHYPMPMIALGTWELSGTQCTQIVELAYELGYRNFDTAFYYKNHKEVGKALKKFPRKNVFISSKIALEQLEGDFSYDKIYSEVVRALEELQIDYIDLFFLHWPNHKLPMDKFFQALFRMREEKMIRSVGVSNFTIHHLKDLFQQKIYPDVNQVEFHPHLYQKELLDFCQKNNILLEAYRPLGKGALITEPHIQKIAKKKQRSATQVILRWLFQKGIIPIVKSSSEKHLRENISIFDFSLSSSEERRLDALNRSKRYCNHEWFEFDY